jgi:hypothetical protein
VFGFACWLRKSAATISAKGQKPTLTKIAFRLVDQLSEDDSGVSVYQAADFYLGGRDEAGWI